MHINEIKKKLSRAKKNKKNLETKYSNLEKQRVQVTSSMHLTQSKINDVEMEIDCIKQNMSEISKNQDTINIEITDHALVRYLERKLNIDVDMLRNEIIDEKSAREISEIKDGLIPTRDGLKLRVKDYKVVTILSNEVNDETK
jgi:chromosome segregation ATPase